MSINEQIDRFVSNEPRLDTIINGSDSTDVTLANGSKFPSLRKLFKTVVNTPPNGWLEAFAQSPLKGTKGDPGGTAMAIGTFMQVAGPSESGVLIPVGTDLVQTSGYSIRGVGAARYAYDPAVNADYVAANSRSSFISSNGRGFKFAEPFATLDQFGAIGDEVTDNKDAINAALATGKSVGVPSGTYATSGQHALTTDQEVYGLTKRSKIKGIGDSDTAFIFQTVGYPSATIAQLATAVVVDPYVSTLTFDTVQNMEPGMRIVLHDPVTDMMEVNVIESMAQDGVSVITKVPVMQPFPVPGRVLVRRGDFIENARLRNLTIFGRGGGAKFAYTDGCEVTDCNIDALTYIGVSMEVSLFGSIRRNLFNKVGASGCGFRVSRFMDCHDNKVRRGPNSDESFTVYYNSSHISFKNNKTAQPLFGGGAAAGNTYLLDTRCAFIDIDGNKGDGSATVHMLVTASRTPSPAGQYGGFMEPEGTFIGCRDINIVGNQFGRANLGHIKVEGGAKRVYINGNTCATVTDATDQITGAQDGVAASPSASIRVMADCEECVIGTNTISGNSGLAIDDRQTNPGATYARKISVNTRQKPFDATVLSRVGVIDNTFGQGVGPSLSLAIIDGKPRLVASVNGDTQLGPLFIDASTLIMHLQGPFASNGDAATAGIGLFEWYFRPDGTIAIRV